MSSTYFYDREQCLTACIHAYNGSCSESDATGDITDKIHHGRLIVALVTNKCNFLN